MSGHVTAFFFAINRHSGAVEWQYDIRKDGDQTGFHGRRLLTDDLVILATDGEIDGFIYAFEQASGVVRWKHSMGSPVPSDVIQHGELIYVFTTDDSLFALELATGTIRWRFAPPDNPRFNTYALSPIIVGDKVVISARDGTMYTLDSDNGRVLWRHQIGARTTSPVGKQNRIYLGNVTENKVIALSADSGSLLTAVRLTGSLYDFMPPVPTDGGLCIAADTTLEFWTDDLSRRLWQAHSPAPLSRSPVVWNEKLVCGTVRGHVLGYDATSGKPSQFIQLSGVVAGITGFNNVLYVGTQEGILYAVRP